MALSVPTDLIRRAYLGTPAGHLGSYLAPLTINTTGSASGALGPGQFIWEIDVGRLWWDQDGTGVAEAMLIADIAAGDGHVPDLTSTMLTIIA